MDFLQHITLETAGIGSQLTHDYFARKSELKKLYQFSPDIQGLKAAVKERKQYPVNRQLLYDVLHKQYAKSVLTEPLKTNIELLLQENTYTVTTGHQLNLFTGPLYFIYKIASVISLSKKLNEEIPGNHFVPVYWMNSEDHDFDEINHFFLKGEKFQWRVDKDKYGPVGKMSLTGIEPLIDEIKTKFGEQFKDDPVFDFIIRAYNDSDTLANAHREIVNKIFGEYGLVILDQDDVELKSTFTDHISDEIFNKSSIKNIEATNKYLEENTYKPQVFVREINYFFTGKGYRERIVDKGPFATKVDIKSVADKLRVTKAEYGLADDTISWTKKELEAELKKNPQYFSPNVVTRPMYQEFILPNIAYIGGPAEIAYWLQYKANFDAHKIFYPTLILRDCFLILPEKKIKKVNDLSVEIEDFFGNLDELLNRYIKENHSHEMNMDAILKTLDVQYNQLMEQVNKIDTSMDGMVKASKQKTLNDLEKIAQKMNKALKTKNEVQLNSIKNFHSIIFPQGVLQERVNNLFDHAVTSAGFAENIIAHSNPVDARLKVLRD